MEPSIKNNTSLKFLLGILVVIILFLIVYIFYPKPTDGNWGQNSTKNSVPEEAKQLYQNTAYGFSLTLPGNVWKNYKMLEFTPQDRLATRYLYFAVPTTDTNWRETNGEIGYASPFAITVFTLDQWEKAKNEPLNSNILGQNNKFVFTFSSWQASPRDLVGTDFNFAQIKSSFSAESI